MPRMPWANSSPFMRLMCAVLSQMSRLRSRWERRRSSSSTLGMRMTDQTCRSPPHQAISARNSLPRSIRSVFARRLRRLTCMLAESTTRQSIATRFQEAREPKSIVARLVAEYDRWLLATHLRPAITGRDELRHQTFAVSAFEWIDARLLTIGKLDTQQPRVLAQLHGAEEPIRGSCRVSCSIHLPVSPLHPVTTWTKEIAGKLRRPSSGS